jgi:hypothetical protein
MSWGSKSGARNKEKFGSLRGRDRDDTDSEDEKEKDGKTKSKDGKFSSPWIIRTSSAPKAQKRVEALYDYEGTAADELSFHQGDEIIVINEVQDDWWMGQLGSKTGLFPSSYVRALSGNGRAPPALPRRPSPDASGYAGDISRRQDMTDTDTDAASEVDHPFGDHMLAARSPVYGHFPHHEHEPPSVENSAAEDTGDEEERPVLPKANDSNTPRAPPPMPPRLPSFKKTPPPPPPARRQSSGAPSIASASSASVVGGTPPIPARRAPPGVHRSSSSVGLAPALSRAGSNHMATASPFDSTTDLTGR